MGDMAAMMAEHMPEDMRALGYAMHESASKFAAEAAKMQSGWRSEAGAGRPFAGHAELRRLP